MTRRPSRWLRPWPNIHPILAMAWLAMAIVAHLPVRVSLAATLGAPTGQTGSGGSGSGSTAAPAATGGPAEGAMAPAAASGTVAPSGTAGAADPAAVAAIAKELNCPLCQGYSLLDCPLQVCGQMRQLIADRLAQGWTSDQVRAQFVADYGPQILSAPPAEGIGLAAWLTPGLAVVFGLALLIWRRRTQSVARAGAATSQQVPGLRHSQAEAAAALPAKPELDEDERDRRRRLEAMLRETDG